MPLAQMSSTPQLPSLPEGPALDRVRGPIELPAYAPWQIVLAVGFVVLFLLLLAWLILRVRRKTKPVVSPYQTALRELNAAKQLTGDDDERFAVLTSQALRRYLETAHALRFQARTSEEFLQALKHKHTFDADFQATLGEILTAFDRIKFAQKSISHEERNHITNTVHSLIDQAHASTQKEGTEP